MKRRLQPVQERHPVQGLEADLRQPRTGHEQPVARDDRFDLALDAPLGPIEAPPLLEVRLPPRGRAQRTAHARYGT